LDSEYDSELDPAVDMRMEDDVDSPDGVDLDGNVDMEMDGEDEEEEDEEEEDEKKEDEEKVKEEVNENEDEDNGNKLRTIGQGEMVNTAADDVDTMLDNPPIVLPEQGQEMCEHTPQPQPLGPAPGPETPDPRRQPRSPEIHPLSWLGHLGLVTPQQPRPAVLTL
jgi:hypothetical protein